MLYPTAKAFFSSRFFLVSHVDGAAGAAVRSDGFVMCIRESAIVGMRLVRVPEAEVLSPGCAGARHLVTLYVAVTLTLMLHTLPQNSRP